MWGLCSCRHCRNLLLCCRTSSGGGSVLCRANGTQHLEAPRRKNRPLIPMASPYVLQAALPHTWLSLGSAITKPVLITMNKQHFWMPDITTGAIQKPSPPYGLSEQQRAMYQGQQSEKTGPGLVWRGDKWPDHVPTSPSSPFSTTIPGIATEAGRREASPILKVTIPISNSLKSILGSC